MVLLCGITSSAVAQFHNTGRGRTSTVWSQIDSSDYRVVYPEGYFSKASGVSLLLDSIYPYIDYSLNTDIKKVPIILRTENLYSNGYVVWAPKREELVMTPALGQYALSWSKQLTVHESRHVAQISSLNHGLTRVATWLLGEAGYSVGLFATPRWILEGDATLAETQFAEYGRGLQPEFTVEYRAMMAAGRDTIKHLDRWIAGSYKNHYPDIYKFGYQTLSAAESYLGSDYFGSMMRYAGTWPILIVPSDIYLSKEYKSSFKKIAQRAFSELGELWEPYSDVNENFELLTDRNPKSYTTFKYPTYHQGDLLSLRGDYDTPQELYSIFSGAIAPMGSISSKPIVHGDRLIYTEYIPHPIYEQVNFSAIRTLELSSGKSRTYQRWGKNWNITAIGDREGFASISMDSLSNSFIRTMDSNFKTIEEYHFDSQDISLHGLSYDNKTEALYFIALDQRGMWIGSLSLSGELKEITRPSVVTIRDLEAWDGVLYFSSIESGKDEIHTLDLSSGVERQATQSNFGSIMPTVGDGHLFFNTYTADGFMVAQSPLDSLLQREVEWSRLPQNILNPKPVEWNVPKVDTIDIYSKADSEPTKRSERRYRAPFALHSWAPASFDGDYLLQNSPMNLTMGVTAFMQSTLSTWQGFATYGWLNNRNWLKGRVEYKGLPLTISIGAEYGGADRMAVAVPQGLAVDSTSLYFQGDITLALPLNLSMGGYSNLLQPSVSFVYSNSQLYDPISQRVSTSMASYAASLWWSSNRYMAHRNLKPRWGYALRANLNGSLNEQIASIYSLYGRAYLPGVAKNHSVTIEGAAQTQSDAIFNLNSKALYLTGVNDPFSTTDYWATTASYSLPLLYPDWGWDGAIYFKRISAELFGGYSSGEYLTNSPDVPLINLTNYTYGVRLTVDFNLIRSYDQSATFTFANPNGEGLFFGFNYSIGF